MITCKQCGEDRLPREIMHEDAVGWTCMYCHLEWLKKEHPELTETISYMEERCGVDKCSKQLQFTGL